MNRLIFGLLTLVLVLSSCYKEQDTFYTEDYDLTITYHDTEFDFTTYKKYYISDSVGLISDYIEKGDADWKNFYNRGGASATIISNLKQHYADLGYIFMDSLVVNGDSVDFAVNTLMTLNEQTGYVYYPGYWYGYPGYWGGYGYGGGYYWKDAKDLTDASSNSYYGNGYYGGYYPWYGGGGGYSYTYKTGNLMIEMADGQKLADLLLFLKDNPTLGPTDPDAPAMKYVWQAFIDGFVSGNDGVSRVTNGIEEAFDNSPYLQQ